jgi:hypothetical protein
MTDFAVTDRHYCRNPRCRSKLPAPVASAREAFCVRGCFNSFYLHRCVVCEGAIEQPKRGRRLICKRAKCRNALQGGSKPRSLPPCPIRETNLRKCRFYWG